MNKKIISIWIVMILIVSNISGVMVWGEEYPTIPTYDNLIKAYEDGVKALWYNRNPYTNPVLREAYSRGYADNGWFSRNEPDSKAYADRVVINWKVRKDYPDNDPNSVGMPVLWPLKGEYDAAVSADSAAVPDSGASAEPAAPAPGAPALAQPAAPGAVAPAAQPAAGAGAPEPAASAPSGGLDKSKGLGPYDKLDEFDLNKKVAADLNPTAENGGNIKNLGELTSAQFVKLDADLQAKLFTVNYWDNGLFYDDMLKAMTPEQQDLMIKQLSKDDVAKLKELKNLMGENPGLLDKLEAQEKRATWNDWLNGNDNYQNIWAQPLLNMINIEGPPTNFVYGNTWKSIHYAERCKHVPAIIYNLRKERQILCKQKTCVEAYAPTGIPISTCDELASIMNCLYVDSAWFKLHGYDINWEYIRSKMLAVAVAKIVGGDGYMEKVLTDIMAGNDPGTYDIILAVAGPICSAAERAKSYTPPVYTNIHHTPACGAGILAVCSIKDALLSIKSIGEMFDGISLKPYFGELKGTDYCGDESQFTEEGDSKGFLGGLF